MTLLLSLVLKNPARPGAARCRRWAGRPPGSHPEGRSEAEHRRWPVDGPSQAGWYDDEVARHFFLVQFRPDRSIDGAERDHLL